MRLSAEGRSGQLETVMLGVRTRAADAVVRDLTD
jgi:hypothetical protein